MSELKAISLFTGAGGLDLGMEAAGFRVALTVENDSNARATIASNRPRWRQAEPGDIHHWPPPALLQMAEVDTDEVALVVAGPPCQPFSKAAYWANGDTRRLADPRASTLHPLMEVVRRALPEVLLIENVKGMAFRGKSEAIAFIRAHLQETNSRHHTRYGLQLVHVNAADYGVPQTRERVFLLAHKGGRELTVPTPTHAAPGAPVDGRAPYATAWDAIGDLDNGTSPDVLTLTGRWADLLPSIPEGRNYLWHTDRGGGRPLFGWRTRYWSFLLKLAKERPSWTLSAAPGPATGPFHWQNRRLSPRELCRLQTFPDDFEVVGSLGEAQRQIGNATPPLLAEVLGREICRQLLQRPARKRLKFAMAARGACPPPERTRPVPRQYLDLEGTHLAHPGPGRGPGRR